MEKQRIYTIAKPCRRLLISGIFVFIYINNLFSQTLTASEIKKLRITPEENQSFFTKTDIKFVLTIPNLDPSKIQVLPNTTKTDVYFKTIKKSSDYENNGTLIEIWYNFDKAGTYQLENLPVIIQNRQRSIQFQPVKILDDPSKQNPRIVIQFSNGTKIYSDHGLYEKPIFSAKAGQKLSFTINLQYATQLVNFKWDIPQDSIFTQTKTYEFTEVKYREKKPSTELIPVATFEWTVLSPGIHSMPKIKLTATGYSGYKNELLMPNVDISFEKTSSSSNSTSETHIFDSAFSNLQQENQLSSQIQITNENCEQLAALYSKERNSVFTHYINKKNRQKYEEELKLPVNLNRFFSIGQLLGSILFFTGALIILLISIHEKKHLRILISSALLMLSMVPLIYTLIKRTEINGICKGCTIYSIPEENAEAFSEIGKGNNVTITESTDNWLYVQLGESGGWCKKDNIIIIK